jgi:putative ABC transport system permease protein
VTSPAADRSTVALRCYRLLLRLTPRAFRRTYGHELDDAFLEMRREPRYQAPGGATRFWIDVLGDLVRARFRMRTPADEDDHFDELTDTALAGLAYPGQPRRRPAPPATRSLTSTITRGFTMWRTDFASALRIFKFRPGLAAVAVLSLGLGLGGNALIFGLVDGLVLRPFPFPESDRFVTMAVTFPRVSPDERFIETLSPAEYLDIRGLSTLQHVSAFDLGNRNLSGGDRPERVFTALVWGNPFATAAMPPLHGRGFLPEEMREGGPRVAILSHRVWLSRFGGDPSLVGRIVRVNGVDTTVVGIMPRGLLLAGTDMWLPLPDNPSGWPRNNRQFAVIGRLAPTATIDQVNAQLATLAARTTGEFGRQMPEYQDWRLQALPFNFAVTREQRPAGLLLLATAGIVLLIACVNLANVWLARTAERQRDVAIRVALGASRSAIVRSLLLETFIVSLAGVVVGAAFASLGFVVTRAFIPEDIRAFGLDVGMTGRVIGYTTILAGLAGLAIGIGPALRASVTRPDTVLRDQSPSLSRPRRALRVREGLIVAEVALATMLLAGAGLLLRSYAQLQSIDPGFNRDRVLTMRLTLPREKYQSQAVLAFFDDLVRRVRALPGVESSAAATQFPPMVTFSSRVRVEGAPSTSAGELQSTNFTLTTPGLFDVLGIRVRTGRVLDERDGPAAPRVAVVNESFARRHLAGRSPIGIRVALAGEDDKPEWAEIVGVTADIRSRGVAAPPAPEVYLPVAQTNGAWNQLFLLVRTAGDPRALLSAVRAEVRRIDPDQPVYAIRTLAEVVDADSLRPRVSTTLMGWFALLALTIAAVGLYGVLTHAVAARTREIGIRMALGADRARVVRRVVGHAGALVIVGAVLGIVGVMAFAPLMSRLLQDVAPRDPITLTVTSGLLIAVGLLAAVVPARRASRIDPVLALRNE